MKYFDSRLAVLGALCVAAIFIPALAHAQSAPVSGTGAEMVVNSLNQIEVRLLELAKNAELMVIGKSILWTLVSITTIWAIVKGMGTGRFLDQVFGDLIPVALAAGVALMLMGAVPGVPNVAESVVKFMQGVSAPLLPAGYGVSHKAGDIVASAIGQSIETIVMIMDMPLAARASSDVPVVGAIVDFFNLLNIAEATLVKLLVTVLCGFVILLGLGIFLGTLFVTQVAYVVALVFMPIFVAFIVFKPLANLFQQWLSFLTTAVFTKVVGLMMLQVTATLFKAMTDIAVAGAAADAAKSASDAYGLDLNRFIILILLSGVSALLMLQVKTIASGIIGSIGVGFEGWSSLTRGITNQSLGGGVGKPDAAPGGGGGGMGNGQRNAISGVTSAMPNALKPLTRAVGNAASTFSGASAANKGYQSAIAAAGGNASEASTVYADLKKMSTAGANAFTAQIDRTNRMRAESGMPPVSVAHPRTAYSGNPKEIRRTTGEGSSERRGMTPEGNVAAGGYGGSNQAVNSGSGSGQDHVVPMQPQGTAHFTQAAQTGAGVGGQTGTPNGVPLTQQASQNINNSNTEGE